MLTLIDEFIQEAHYATVRDRRNMQLCQIGVNEMKIAEAILSCVLKIHLPKMASK
jgi:hypothetical protein